MDAAASGPKSDSVSITQGVTTREDDGGGGAHTTTVTPVAVGSIPRSLHGTEVPSGSAPSRRQAAAKSPGPYSNTAAGPSRSDSTGVTQGVSTRHDNDDGGTHAAAVTAVVVGLTVHDNAAASRPTTKHDSGSVKQSVSTRHDNDDGSTHTAPVTQVVVGSRAPPAHDNAPASRPASSKNDSGSEQQNTSMRPHRGHVGVRTSAAGDGMAVTSPATPSVHGDAAALDHAPSENDSDGGTQGVSARHSDADGSAMSLEPPTRISRIQYYKDAWTAIKELADPLEVESTGIAAAAGILIGLVLQFLSAIPWMNEIEGYCHKLYVATAIVMLVTMCCAGVSVCFAVRLVVVGKEKVNEGAKQVKYAEEHWEEVASNHGHEKRAETMDTALRQVKTARRHGDTMLNVFFTSVLALCTGGVMYGIVLIICTKKSET